MQGTTVLCLLLRSAQAGTDNPADLLAGSDAAATVVSRSTQASLANLTSGLLHTAGVNLTGGRARAADPCGGCC